MSEEYEVEVELVFRTFVTVKRLEALAAYPDVGPEDAVLRWAREFAEAAPLDTWDKDTFDLTLISRVEP